MASLTVGTQFGPYEITALLGKGGMGEVYRARDLKLKREVAIKILPDEFSRDSDRTSRFQREAEVLASLNHPNIAAIYDLQEVDGSRFLVLELVEGETLAERIARGALPLSEAIEIAKQICDALEAAHERGIIHRDLKPANLKISPDGKLKVLDFGLAKTIENSPASTALSNSPTLLSGSMGGMIIGTAAYMSPEQAKGRPADKRSDVWAFGCVFYEMLAGKSAFEGDDVSDTLAAVLRAEPDWTALPPDLSPCVRALIDGSLKKDRRDRIGDMAAARFLMSGPIGLSEPTAPARPKPLWARALPIAMTALVVAGLTGIGSWLLRTSAQLPVSRSTFVLPEGQNFTGVTLPLVAISADGLQIAYVANRQLHIRSMSDFDSKAIPGTDDALVTSPVFSPDGKSIIFYSGTERAIKRISTGGGTAVTVCPLDNAPYGITWAEDNIAFAVPGKGIMQVPAKGGTPEFLVKLDASEIATAPQLLPEPDTVLFSLASAVNNERQVRWQVVVQSLKTGERKPLISNAGFARYLRTGHIVYASISPLGASLLAVPFDAKHLRLTGEPTQVVEAIRGAAANGLAQFSVSETGTLIYLPGRAAVPSEQLDLALVDRKGGVAPLKLPPAAYEQPRLSPDGKKVVYSIYDGKEANIWIYDLSGTSAPRRLTYGGRNRFPIWSGNGERIAFQSDREGDAAIYWQRADVSGTAERLTKPEKGSVHIPESWSPNGETILFTVTNKESVVSLWAFSLRDKRATEFAAEFGGVRSSTPTEAAFSPDGQWVAYVTTTLGNPGPYVQPRGLELYVRPFPPNDQKYLISSGNGIHPAWSNNGRELIFNYPGQLMSVSLLTHPVFSFTPPMQFLGGGILVMQWPAQRAYDVAPDGRLIGTIALRDNTITAPPLAPQIRIVVNWFEELKQRVPVH